MVRSDKNNGIKQTYDDKEGYHSTPISMADGHQYGHQVSSPGTELHGLIFSLRDYPPWWGKGNFRDGVSPPQNLPLYGLRFDSERLFFSERYLDTCLVSLLKTSQKRP